LVVVVVPGMLAAAAAAAAATFTIQVSPTREAQQRLLLEQGEQKEPLQLRVVDLVYMH
jgi:hypothetical protein